MENLAAWKFTATLNTARMNCSILLGPKMGWECPGPTRRVAAAPARRSPLVVSAAKKGSGGQKKGGGGQNKGSGSPADPHKPALPYLSTPVIMQNLLLIESYFRKTGRQLFTDEIEISEAARALWEAPFAVLAHDASDPEPLFVYGNKAALSLFECEWAELVGSPSSRSVEPEAEVQADRSSALAAALEKGSIEDYEGRRISLKGTRFKISKATLFNVSAPSGARVGQAAVIRSWEYEDGRVGGEAAAREEESANEAAGLGAPSEEDLAAAAATVAERGAAVRDLKERQGLGNGCPEVQAAVEALLQGKAELEALQKRAGAVAAEAAAAEQLPA